MRKFTITISCLCIALAACRSGDPAKPADSEAMVVIRETDGATPPPTEPDEPPILLGEAPISSDPTKWNAPIDPALTIDGFGGSVSAELPIVELTGRALGGGLLDASLTEISRDSSFVFLEIGRAAGCATFEHFALVPTDEAGFYELFYDTDNTCEAFGSSAYRTRLADLSPAIDGTITITDPAGDAISITLG